MSVERQLLEVKSLGDAQQLSYTKAAQFTYFDATRIRASGSRTQTSITQPTDRGKTCEDAP